MRQAWRAAVSHVLVWEASESNDQLSSADHVGFQGQSKHVMCLCLLAFESVPLSLALSLSPSVQI